MLDIWSWIFWRLDNLGEVFWSCNFGSEYFGCWFEQYSCFGIHSPGGYFRESATCCSHSLGFRKRNLALDCRPLTISNFIYDACQQRIAAFACVAEVFWHHGVSCSMCRSGLCVATHIPLFRTRSHSLTFSLLSVTARLSVNQTLSTKIRIATSMGFLSASSMLREEN